MGGTSINATPCVRPWILTLLLLLSVLAALPAPTLGAPDDPVVIEWRVEDGPHVLNSTLVIPEDETLSMGPGVEVRLAEGASITVKGTLLINGTESDPVRIGSDTPGRPRPNSWGQVQLHALSAGNDHVVRWADFAGADTALSINAVDVTVEDCTFETCRYGILARAYADVNVHRSRFWNNTAAGLEWETGSVGSADDCDFVGNNVAVYCYDGATSEVLDSTFRRNYHHVSWAQNSSGALLRCELVNATAEAIECYWYSSPLIEDVLISGPVEQRVFLRESSRPRFIGGTPLTAVQVDTMDGASYAVAGMWITVEVQSDEGEPLKGANVTVRGASGDLFSNGTTAASGRLHRVFMARYTVSSSGGHEPENPHNVTVEWQGHRTWRLAEPADLTDDDVLVVELAISPPKRGTEIPWLMLLVGIVVLLAALLAARTAGRRRDE